MWGGRLADWSWPPGTASFSKSSTSYPRPAAARAAESPAGPAPITQSRFTPSTGIGAPLYSLPQAGLKVQVADFISKVSRSMQPWLQATHQRISSKRPASAFRMKSGSVRCWRPKLIRSASPAAIALSASSGIVDPADADHRDAHGFLDRPGPEEIEAGFRVHRGDAQVSRRRIDAHGGVDRVDAGRDEARGEPLHEFQVVAAADHLVRRDPDDDGEIGTDRLPDGRDDLQDEARPVLLGAAVLVRPLVGKGGEELVQQVAVGAVDLDGVESRLFRPRRRPAEGVDHEGDPLPAHLLAGLAEDDARDRRKGPRASPPRPLRRSPCPHGGAGGRSSRLPRGWPAVSRVSPGMNSIAPGADLVGKPLPARIDGADLRDDEPRAAPGPPGEVGDQAVADRAVGDCRNRSPWRGMTALFFRVMPLIVTGEKRCSSFIAPPSFRGYNTTIRSLEAAADKGVSN